MNERAKEVSDVFMSGANLIGLAEYLSSLPEFNPPKEEWIKPSDRMPEHDQPIWFVANDGTLIIGAYEAGVIPWRGMCGDRTIWNIATATHWMPRHVPLPPVEEDSPLVKKIKTIPYHPTDYLTAVIEIIKLYEKES